MLTGIQTLLTQPLENFQAGMQQLLTEHVAEIANLPCVEGSLKKVYTLPGERFALVCFREKATSAGKALLTKEIQLINYLQSCGLPTVRIYSEPFILNDQYVFLMDWIPDANFIDVKDQEAAPRKVISTLLDINIPSGEGWVLKKAQVEQDISEKVFATSFSMDAVKLKALMLEEQFAKISKILTVNGLMIADLQFLINAKGVFIIDPIDVVKMLQKPNSANMVDYCSVVDDAKQANPDFVKLLYDGKRVLDQCYAFCRSLDGISSKTTFQEKLLSFIQAKEALSPRGKGGLVKTLLTKSLPAMASLKGSHPLQPLSPKVMQEINNTKEIKISPPSSPEKQSRPVKKENDPDSPTKLLVFQFGSTGLRKSKQSVVKQLFIDEQDFEATQCNTARPTQ
jgi:hypothetical protein